MAKFIPNDKGIEAMLQQAGRNLAAKYEVVDAEAREAHNTTASDDAAVLADLRARLAAQQLPETTNMKDWVAAIVAGENFQIDLHVG